MEPPVLVLTRYTPGRLSGYDPPVSLFTTVSTWDCWLAAKTYAEFRVMKTLEESPFSPETEPDADSLP